MKIFLICLVGLVPLAVQAGFQGDTVPYSIRSPQIDGLKIIKNLPNTNGLKKLGVKKDDIVLSVDYRSINNRDSALSAYQNPNPQIASVLRNSKRLTLARRK